MANILFCMRVGPDIYRVPGTVEMPCARCGHAILVSPSGLAIIAGDDAEAVCHDHVSTEELAEHDIRPIDDAQWAEIAAWAVGQMAKENEP